MKITVNVEMEIDTIWSNSTPKSIMDATKWQIENMESASIKVLDWNLKEIKRE